MKRLLLHAMAIALLFAPGCRAGSDRGQTGVKPGSDQGQTGVKPGSEAHQHPSTAATTMRRPVLDTAPAPGPAPDGMVWIPGGEFWMGCATCGLPDATPVHLV